MPFLFFFIHLDGVTESRQLLFQRLSNAPLVRAKQTHHTHKYTAHCRLVLAGVCGAIWAAAAAAAAASHTTGDRRYETSLCTFVSALVSDARPSLV